MKYIRNNFKVQFSTLFILLVTLFFSSILLGYTKTNFTDLYNTFFNFTETSEQLVIKTVRIPRAIIAVFIGASLSISGLLMQTITKNPMASPSLLGINSGAAFFVVIVFVNNPDISYHLLVWASFIGAILSALFVYIIGGGLKGEQSTIKLTLAGAATSALFMSFTQGLLHRNQKSYEEILFWLSGSVEGRSLDHFYQVFPYILIGFVIVFFIASKLNIFSLGEEIAKGLGLNVTRLKLFVLIAVVLLAGAAVAVAGPISLVGLIIPHLTKHFFESDYKKLVLVNGILGAVFLLFADLLARFIIYPNEVPVGVITALVGAPFFIYIARKADY